MSVINPGLFIEIPTPIRISRSKLIKSGVLETTVEFAARKASVGGAILILLDSDRDCAAQFGPELLKRASLARSDIPISVVLAQKEFESWFLAAALSLRGHRGLPHDLEPPQNPEEILGAKEWLSSRILRGSYSPTVDQPSLTATMDLVSARFTNSFDKLYREIEKLLGA